MPDLAPIALFTFKRPEHTRRTLEALALNPDFNSSPLYVFCDGSRRPNEDEAVQATRNIVRDWPHPNKTVYEAPANRGLAASIIDGVGRLCAEYGRVIVVEDDLVVAPYFLNFLNRGLQRYVDDERVMQISGHMFPVDFTTDTSDAVFLPFTTSWGWATWQRAWKNFDPEMSAFAEIASNGTLRRRFDLDGSYPYFSMLKKQKAGLIDSWAIRWYLSVFMRSGLALYPRQSLVQNEGFDGSGTHCGVSDENPATLSTEIDGKFDRLPAVALARLEYKEVAALLRSQNTLIKRGRRYMRSKYGWNL